MLLLLLTTTAILYIFSCMCMYLLLITTDKIYYLNTYKGKIEFLVIFPYSQGAGEYFLILFALYHLKLFIPPL